MQAPFSVASLIAHVLGIESSWGQVHLGCVLMKGDSFFSTISLDHEAVVVTRGEPSSFALSPKFITVGESINRCNSPVETLSGK